MPTAAKTFYQIMQSRKTKPPENRPSAHMRGYGTRWRKVRLNHLKIEPLCRKCKKNDEITPATIVDHIKPHKGNYELMWDTDNFQSLCKTCHDKKTATEDGGFGRKNNTN